MTVTSTTEHNVLASGGDHVKRYLSIATRPEIFTDQITAIGRDADNDTIIYLDHANSWAGLINPGVPHLTVDIGTTAGARDVGSVRLRYFNSTNTRMTVAETGDSDVPIEVGHYASIRLEFRPWQIPKRVVLTRDGGGNITAVTEYFDYDIGYSGGANALDPKPNITAGINADGSPKEVRRARWVDGYGTPSEQTYATFTLSAQHSVAMNYGAVIDTTVWTWTGSGALVSGYAGTEETIELELEAGFHYVGLLVQDDAGAQSPIMWIGVWVHNDANPPFTQFAVTSDETGYDQGVAGREMQLEFFGDANEVDESVLPKGALLCYWEEAEYDDGDPPESYRAECYGWVFNDEPLLKREDSTYGVKFGSTASWKPLFDANSITLINTGATPTTYTEMAHMTVDRVLDWSLRAVDTLRHLVNVYYSGVTAEVERMTLPLGSAWTHLTETAPKALLAQPACDSYGNIWFRTPIWAIPETARAVRPTAIALTAADWWHDDGFALPTELPPTVGVVNAAGEYWSAGDRVLYASIAPMASGGAGIGKVKMPDQFLQLPNPQGMLNILSGLYYAHANNQRKRLALTFAGNLDVIEPAWAEPVSVTWAYETVRGVELDAALFVVTGVSTAHTNEPDNRTPPKRITLTLEQVTVAAPGKTMPVLQMSGVEQPAEDTCNLTAGFTANVTECDVEFTDTTSGDLLMAWFWDFGDGLGYSLLQNPTYAYAEPGEYTVTLYVLSECYGFDDYSDTVTVTVDREDVTAAFSSVSSGLDVDFTDASTADSGIASWAWDFGDDSTSTSQNPSHTYAASGTYLVTLTVANDCGYSDSVQHYVTVVDVEGGEWAYTFDFTENYYNFDGEEWVDGTGFIGQFSVNYVPPGHIATGVYTATIDRAFADTLITGITVFFTLNGTRNVGCSYHAVLEKDGSGTLNASSGSYHTPGSYSQGFVVLTATDADYTRITVIYGSGVTDFGADVPPGGGLVITGLALTGEGVNPFAVADFDYSGSGLDIDFTDQSTAAGTITAWDWDWGDATAHGSTQNPSHTYSSPDTYTVTLTITVDGQQLSAEQELTVPIGWSHTFDFTADNGGWASGYATGAVASYGAGVGWADADYTPGSTSDGWRTVSIRKTLSSSEITSVRVVGTFTPGTVYTTTYGFALYLTSSGGSPVDSILHGSMPSGAFDHTWSGSQAGVTGIRVHLFSDLDTASPYVFTGDILITSIVITGTGSDPF